MNLGGEGDRKEEEEEAEEEWWSFNGGILGEEEIDYSNFNLFVFLAGQSEEFLGPNFDRQPPLYG